MAEGLLRTRLAEQGIDAEVASAGLYESGHPATDHAVAVVAARGGDIAAHRSRNLDAPEVGLADADLVLAMERRHLQEALIRAPDLRSRAFTLVDFVRRAEAAPPRRPDQDLRAYASALAAGRSTADVLGVGDDGVADPVGLDRERYEATAALLDDLLRRAVACAFPLQEARSA
jgi:protein-tyrosine phosphatase